MARIHSVSDGPATNGSPPKATILVEEVLRGELKNGEYQALWEPPSHGVDWVGTGEFQAWEAWSKQPMKKPKQGGRYILVGSFNGTGLFIVSSLGQFVFSPSKRQWALRAIEKGREEDRLIAQEKEAKRQRREQALAAWKARLATAPLEKLVQSSSFIATGRPAGGLSTFRVEDVLKGQKSGYYVDGVEFVSPALSEQQRNEIVSSGLHRGRFLFFVKTLVPRPPKARDVLADPQFGIMPADPEVLARVRQLVGPTRP